MNAYILVFLKPTDHTFFLVQVKPKIWYTNTLRNKLYSVSKVYHDCNFWGLLISYMRLKQYPITRIMPQFFHRWLVTYSWNNIFKEVIKVLGVLILVKNTFNNFTQFWVKLKRTSCANFNAAFGVACWEYMCQVHYFTLRFLICKMWSLILALFHFFVITRDMKVFKNETVMENHLWNKNYKKKKK